MKKEKKKNLSHRVRCRIKDQVQDSSQIDLPSHPGKEFNPILLFNISAAQEVGLAALPTRSGF